MKGKNSSYADKTKEIKELAKVYKKSPLGLAVLQIIRDEINRKKKSKPITCDFLIEHRFTTKDGNLYRMRIGSSELSINPENGNSWITNPTGAGFNIPVPVKTEDHLRELYHALTLKKL